MVQDMFPRKAVGYHRREVDGSLGVYDCMSRAGHIKTTTLKICALGFSMSRLLRISCKLKKQISENEEFLSKNHTV